MWGHLGSRNLCLKNFGKGMQCLNMQCLNKLGKGMQCNIPHFKHLSKVVLKKKIFLIFSMYCYGSKLGPLCRGHLRPCDLDLNKLVKNTRQCYIPNFKYISQVVLKKKFFNIFMYFYGLDPLGPSFEQIW